MKGIRGKVSLILFCLLIFSCAKKQTIRQYDLEPYTGPVTIKILKQAVGFRNSTSIKSLVDIKVFKNGEPAGDLSGVFAYKSPGHMRISLFGPFGMTLMEILITKGIFQTYIPPKNIIYEWRSPEVSFNAILDDRFRYIMEEQGDMFVLYAYKSDNSNSELAAVYFFDRTYLVNRTIIFYKNNSEILKVNFDSFDSRIPEKIRISFRNGSALEIFLQEPEFDVNIPGEYFSPVAHGDKNVMPLQDVLKRFD